MQMSETLEVPIRGRVQLRILELGDEAREKQKKSIWKSQLPKTQTIFLFLNLHFCWECQIYRYLSSLFRILRVGILQV